MAIYQVIWNATTRTAAVQNDGATPPAGSTIAGKFEDDNGPFTPNISDVLYHAVRDALYSQGVWDMQRLVIIGGAIPPVNPVLPSVVRSLLAGTAGQTTQPLSWQAPATGTGPFTYRVGRRAGSSTGVFTNIGGPITGLNYTATGLTANTEYDYEVFAVNAAGNGTAVILENVKTAAAVADTRPIFFRGPANAHTTNTASLMTAGTRMGTNGSKAVASFPVLTTVGNYGWVALPAAPSAAGATFTDLSNGFPGDWNGAGLAGDLEETGPVPAQSTVVVTFQGAQYRLFRMEYIHSSPASKNWSIA